MPSLGRKISNLKFSDRELPEKSSDKKSPEKTRVKRSEAKNRIRKKYNEMKKGGKY